MVKFKDFECFSSTFQGKFNFQGLFKTVLYIQVLFKPVLTLWLIFNCTAAPIGIGLDKHFQRITYSSLLTYVLGAQTNPLMEHPQHTAHRFCLFV